MQRYLAPAATIPKGCLWHNHPEKECVRGAGPIKHYMNKMNMRLSARTPGSLDSTALTEYTAAIDTLMLLHDKLLVQRANIDSLMFDSLEVLLTDVNSLSPSKPYEKAAKDILRIRIEKILEESISNSNLTRLEELADEDVDTSGWVVRDAQIALYPCKWNGKLGSEPSSPSSLMQQIPVQPEYQHSQLR